MASYPAPPPPTTNGPTHWDLVGSWMKAEGGAFLRQHDGNVSAETLTAFLLQQAIHQSPGPEAPGHNGTQARGALTWSQIENQAKDTSKYLLDTFRPAYKPRFTRTQASKGGRASKRSSPLLEALRGMDWASMTIAETAAVLHCTPRTAEKLRARLRAEPDADQLILDEIDREATERANSVRANKPEPVAANPVRANNPVVSIATGKPLSVLEQELINIKAEREQRAYDAAPDMLAIIGL